MKERVTLTLDSNILKDIDKNVDGFKIKNRSHAIELLLLRAIGAHVPKKALILVGGKGTRLRPITYEIPKALIPINGKTVTQYLFSLLKKFGINEVILAVGYLKEKIQNHFEDGSKYGVNIKYVEEDKPLGTAGPLRLARHLLDETFIVSNGDELKDINIEDMYALHKENKALATIALTTVPDPSKYGVARLSGSKILEFVEKPDKNKAPSNLINSGFYIIEPEVLGMIPEGFSMLEKDVFPKLAKEGRLFGYPFSGYWSDIGTIDKYEKVIKDVREGKYKI